MDCNFSGLMDAKADLETLTGPYALCHIPQAVFIGVAACIVLGGTSVIRMSFGQTDCVKRCPYESQSPRFPSRASSEMIYILHFDRRRF